MFIVRFMWHEFQMFVCRCAFTNVYMHDFIQIQSAVRLYVYIYLVYEHHVNA